MPRARPVFLVPRAQSGFQGRETPLSRYLGPAGSAPVDLRTIAANPDLSVPWSETAPDPTVPSAASTTAGSVTPQFNKEDMLCFLEESCEVNLTYMVGEVKELRKLIRKHKKMLTDLRDARSVTAPGSQANTNHRVSSNIGTKMTIVKCSSLSSAAAAVQTTLG